MLVKTTRMANLFDFYGSLLTEKQKLMIELYYYHDLSLGEISEQLDITRQAIHDNLRRSEKLLEHYETKLHLMERHQNSLQEINKLESLLNANDIKDGQIIIKALKEFLIP